MRVCAFQSKKDCFVCEEKQCFLHKRTHTPRHQPLHTQPNLHRAHVALQQSCEREKDSLFFSLSVFSLPFPKLQSTHQNSTLLFFSHCTLHTHTHMNAHTLTLVFPRKRKHRELVKSVLSKSFFCFVVCVCVSLPWRVFNANDVISFPPPMHFGRRRPFALALFFRLSGCLSAANKVEQETDKTKKKREKGGNPLTKAQIRVEEQEQQTTTTRKKERESKAQSEKLWFLSLLLLSLLFAPASSRERISSALCLSFLQEKEKSKRLFDLLVLISLLCLSRRIVFSLLFERASERETDAQQQQQQKF